MSDMQQTLSSLQPSGTVRAPGLVSLLRRGMANPRAVSGLVLMAIAFTVALGGPFVAPYAPAELVGAPFDVPQAGLLLGTDALGRDVLSRLLWGGRNLVWMSLCATALGLALGTTLGLVAAFSRGTVDEIIMRIIDIKMAFPSVVFSLLFVTMFGPGPFLLVVLVSLSQAPSVARVIRGAAIPVVDREYVLWARAVGLPTSRILVGEVLPNVTSPILVEFGLRLMWAISLLAGLSFLGYGIQPPEADWGLMVNESRNALGIQPWAVLAPVAAIAVFTIGGNLFADGMARVIARTEGQ